MAPAVGRALAVRSQRSDTTGGLMTDVAPIDRARALELLAGVVAEAGATYVYPEIACRYVRDGAPSCLVGRALHAHGVPLDRLAYFDDADHGSSVDDRYSQGLLPWVSEDAVRVFQVAQTCQDRGDPWGDALAAARQSV